MLAKFPREILEAGHPVCLQTSLWRSSFQASQCHKLHLKTVGRGQGTADSRQATSAPVANAVPQEAFLLITV